MRSIFLCADRLDPKIQDFREKNDPLGKLIEPHITLVFPFVSVLSDEALISHVETQVAATNRFQASLNPQPIMDTGYVYFSLLFGVDQVSKLHERLYDGPLVPHLEDRSYVSHITMGRGNGIEASRIADEASSLNASATFSVSKLKIERISPGGASQVIKTIWLK
ncbi:2'-5' RNA ligase family protein [uncultured Gilvimarinus sp.]|uniref:2'-5' RNA ligase family protein n=1 Tax=uncultured Gilvimarinus sp. TaxID=1689143 RepID=UPI0030DA091D